MAADSSSSWKDMWLGMDKQYDDDDCQIQVMGPGNEFWMFPNWLVEAFCKKPGCYSNHFAGSVKKGTKLSEIVTLYKDTHKVCQTKKEKSKKTKNKRSTEKSLQSSLASSKVGKTKKVSKE